jgi:predicted HicB family RNase H-like nuclease
MTLENLLGSTLHREQATEEEIDRLREKSAIRLNDAQNEQISRESRFDLAYEALLQLGNAGSCKTIRRRTAEDRGGSKQMNANLYSITVRQIEVDGQELFEARVRELPDVVDFGDTWQEAYELAVDTIETTAEFMAEEGRQMPEPAAIEDDYSGRVTLRVPKTLHRRLAEQAETENISLNQYLVSLLAYHAGTRYAGEKTNYRHLRRTVPETRETKGRSKQEIDQQLAEDRGSWTP